MLQQATHMTTHAWHKTDLRVVTQTPNENNHCSNPINSEWRVGAGGGHNIPGFFSQSFRTIKLQNFLVINNQGIRGFTFHFKKIILNKYPNRQSIVII